MVKLHVKTNKGEEIIDITSKVREAVEGKEGKACLVYCPHTTCGILINENYDSDVQKDILDHLEKIPKDGWKHNEGNSDAHIKSMIVGTSQVIPIVDGVLGLGRWQGIGLAEFDGPRERVVVVEVI